eukprot:s3274_g3.t2
MFTMEFAEGTTLSDETVLRMHAHVCMRSANLLGRIGSGIAENDITDLCGNLRAGLRNSLAIASTNSRKHLPTARKLIEWLVHIAISQTTGTSPRLAWQCWQQALRACSEGVSTEKVLGALSHGRMPAEQLQLLQSLSQLARRGRISPDVAEPMARVMQFLMQLVPPLWGQLSLPDKEAASRVVASALEALTLCLPPSPERSISSLDWADAFIEELTGSSGELNRGDPSLSSLQMLFSVVLRARLQQSEEFRKADPQLLMMQRSDLFTLVLQGQSLQEFKELSGDTSPVAASPAIPKSGHCSTWLRLAGLEGTAAQNLPGFCCYSMQAVESLRLQLPRGLASALLCLRQLRLHYAVLLEREEEQPITKVNAGWRLAHCASFARLTVAQSSEPDFAAALSRSGASRRIPALAVVVQLERCIQSQGEEAETLLEVARLRLLQAQASQQGAISDDEGDHKEPARFVAAALTAWQKSLAVDSKALAARTPAAVADALQAMTDASFAGGSHAVLLLRDASDAAHLLEGMDLDHLAFRALVLCLACLCRRHGSAALWWRPGAMEVSEKVHSCTQAQGDSMSENGASENPAAQQTAAAETPWRWQHEQGSQAPHSWWASQWQAGTQDWRWHSTSSPTDGWNTSQYGSWQHQWRPSWGYSSWHSAAWGNDSGDQQKTDAQESGPSGNEDNPLGGSEDTARRQSASTAEGEAWMAGEGTGSLDDDHGSSSKETSGSKSSGKDFIPEYDWTGPMREYQRRVKLFELSTGIDPTFRAQKLMEKLTGNAWLATESIPLESLKHPHGVSRLLDHLWKELEPLEFLRTFQTLADFYKSFRRTPGQQYVSYDMDFRRHAQRLEEIGGGISGVTKAYWFLEKAGLSQELRKQVVAAAGGQYDYAKLRAAVMATVPQVNKEEDGHSSHHGGGSSGNRQWRKHTAKDQMVPELLEEELQVLLTQAAKKRAQVEKARGFNASSGGKGTGRNETPEARAKRIAELKQRMPCSACKANGKTVYGHWHSDPECPFGKKAGKPVMAVVEEELSDSDEDYGPDPSDVFVAWADDSYWCASAVSGKERAGMDHLLALSDTCCARTVAGESWANMHMSHLHETGLDVYVVDESRPFRFGAGPKIMSEYSIILPMNIPGATVIPWLRVSVVQQDVPLLLSKNALKGLGACLDLGQAKITFSKLDTSMQLVETPTGLCGFMINSRPNEHVPQPEFPPCEMLEGEMEVSGELEDGSKLKPPDTEMTVNVCPHLERPQDDEALSCNGFAEDLLQRRDFTYESLEKLVDKLPYMKSEKQREINQTRGRKVQGIMSGLWTHGGFHGLTSNATKFSPTIRYLNAFMKDKLPEHKWTSIVVMRNVKMGVHRDNHNACHAKTATVTFGNFTKGQLWMADEQTPADDPGRALRKGRDGSMVERDGVFHATPPAARI